MMEKRYIVALEIASSKIKGAIASMPLQKQAGNDPQITIEAIEETPTQDSSVQHGRIQNIVETAKASSSIISSLEQRKALGATNPRITAVYTSVGGRSLRSIKVQAEISLTQPSNITEDSVEKLKIKALSQIAKDNDVLSVIATGYKVDNVPQPNPVGTFGSHLSGEFTVVLCNVANRRNLEMVITDRLNLDICDNLIVLPLAEADLVLTPEERQIGCVFIDMGAETTTVAIYKNGVLQQITTLPLGSRNITRDITAGLGLTEERAEVLKCSIGNAIEERPGFVPGSNEALVNNYVRARIGEIIANIMAQINASGYASTDLPGGCIVVGSGARMRNFNTLLENQSKLKVRTGTCGSEFRLADGSVNVIDNIDILSIVYKAANATAYVCIETEQQRVKRTEAEKNNPFAETPGNEYYDDNSHNYTGSDDDICIDDEELEKIKVEETDAEYRKKIDELRKQRAKTLAQRKRLEDAQSFIDGDAPIDGDDDFNKNKNKNNPVQINSPKRTLLNKFKQSFVDIFTLSDDADLDDEYEASKN